jgi:hypothetical protein
MRGAIAAAVGLMVGLAVGCVDFDLDSRRYRCDGTPNICGDGMVCGSDGYCVPAGAAVDGGATGEVCTNGTDDDGDDAVDCADDECPDDTTCGTGCICDGTGPHELACGDRLDNDNDDLIDCNDDDCPSCGGTMVCCPDGTCAIDC